MSNLVDITHTVKASVANGRKLFRNMDTGEAVWEQLELPEVPVSNPPPKPKAKPKYPKFQD